MVQVQESQRAPRLAGIARVALAGRPALGETTRSDLSGARAGLATVSTPRPSRSCCSKPGRVTRFQLLGMVEAKAANRRSAATGLAIRGSMMGADAVVDLNQERLPGFFKTEHRASGMAVRAVDGEGRLELKTRWFSGQIGQVAIIMLAVAALELCVDLLGIPGGRDRPS